jgi:hypothetical protein
MYINRSEAKMQMEVVYGGRNNEYKVAEDDKRCPFCDSRIGKLGYCAFVVT